MKNIFSYIKGIRNAKNQQELSDVLEKVTEIVDNKLVQLQEESKEKELDPVIIKDEEGNFVDCCNIIKPNSPQVYFTAISYFLKNINETQHNIRNRIKRISVIFYTIFMFFYTVFCISHIADLNNKVVIWIFMSLLILLFAVMTIINILIYKKSNGISQTNKQIRIVKNYRSAAVILRRLMLLWSIGLTIYSMRLTWDHGISYQILNISVLILTSIILLFIIYREIKKVTKRAGNKKQGKIKLVFSTFKDTLINSKTAKMITDGKLESSEPKKIESSKFKEDFIKRKESAKTKKQLRKNNNEIKKAYKESYKNEMKKLKENYINNINKLE